MNSYLITIDPPKTIANIVDKYRNIYSKHTTYKIPPHITIYPPFYLKQISEKEILDKLKNAFSNTKPFALNFDKVDYFEENNNVAYFAPDEKSLIKLKGVFSKTITSLSGKTQDVYEDYKLSTNDFKPHITIAEKIPTDELKKVKKGLSDVNEKLSFDCNFIYLYKQEKGSRIWREVGKIKLRV